jgi:RNA polymerase sigma-70 factor (ECF subfamily)
MSSNPLLDEFKIRRLVKQAQEGDAEAFGKIYDHFFDPIYRYTAFRAPDELVEDLVADIFVKAWEKLHRYKVYRNVPFGAWLFRIARHTVIDAYRTERHFEEVPEDLADTDVLNRADTNMHHQDLLRTVRQALRELPRRYREILLLCYVAELPHSEVARVLHLTTGAVRILKFRALRRLEALLPRELKEHATVYSP